MWGVGGLAKNFQFANDGIPRIYTKKSQPFSKIARYNANLVITEFVILVVSRSVLHFRQNAENFAVYDI